MKKKALVLDDNSISDTEEALQVVDIIEDTYNDLIIDVDPPSISGTCQLDNLGDLTQPTTLKIPDIVSEIGRIKYEVTSTFASATNRLSSFCAKYVLKISLKSECPNIFSITRQSIPCWVTVDAQYPLTVQTASGQAARDTQTETLLSRVFS